jgi:RHS repeat-associated protein
MGAAAQFTYDANGNTLSDAQGRSFTWDFENRLIQAVVPGTNGGTTTFKYDPFGRRIQKSGPLGTTNYLYDGINAIEQIDNSGNVLARYAQGGLIDEPVSVLQAGTTSYYQTDALGSITSLSTAAATLANTYTYDSFGNLTNSTGALKNTFQYTGREFDSETGLNYNRARYYNPIAGRFISEDALGFGGSGSNFYPYVRNDPADLIDPLGLTNCVETPLGPVCNDTGLQNSWFDPQEPQLPPIPSQLTPNPPPPPPPPPCKCDMVEMDREVDRVVWKNTKHEIFFWEPIFMTGEGGAEFFAWKFGKRWIPAVKWVKVGVEVYDTYEEVEKIRGKYRHCGWGF